MCMLRRLLSVKLYTNVRNYFFFARHKLVSNLAETRSRAFIFSSHFRNIPFIMLIKFWILISRRIYQPAWGRVYLAKSVNGYNYWNMRLIREAWHTHVDILHVSRAKNFELLLSFARVVSIVCRLSKNERSELIGGTEIRLFCINTQRKPFSGFF